MQLRQFVAKLQRLLEDLQVLLATLAALRHPDTPARIGIRGQLQERYIGRVVHPEYEVAAVIALSRRLPCLGHPVGFGRRDGDRRGVIVDVLLERKRHALEFVDDFLGALALVRRQRRPAILEFLEQILPVNRFSQVLGLHCLHPLIQGNALVDLGLKRQQLLQAGLCRIARHLVRRDVLQQVHRIGKVGKTDRQRIQLGKDAVGTLACFHRLQLLAHRRQFAITACADRWRIEHRNQRPRGFGGSHRCERGSERAQQDRCCRVSRRERHCFLPVSGLLRAAKRASIREASGRAAPNATERKAVRRNAEIPDEAVRARGPAAEHEVPRAPADPALPVSGWPRSCAAATARRCRRRAGSAPGQERRSGPTAGSGTGVAPH